MVWGLTTAKQYERRLYLPSLRVQGAAAHTHSLSEEEGVDRGRGRQRMKRREGLRGARRDPGDYIKPYLLPLSQPTPL